MNITSLQSVIWFDRARLMSKVDPDWFKARMGAAGVSLRELAPEMGMAPSQLSRAINGERKLTLHEAYELASHLHVTVDEIYLHLAGDRKLIRHH